MAKPLDKKQGHGTIGENIRVIVYALFNCFFCKNSGLPAF